MSVALQRHVPVRDKPTWITYLQLSMFSWFVCAFGAAQVLLRDEQGTTRSVSALHSTFFAVGGLIGALITARVIGPVGRGRLIRGSLLGGLLGIVVYAAPDAPPWQSMLGIFIFSLFSTGFLIACNAFLMSHQGPAGPAAITEGNALAAAGGLFGPLFVAIGIGTVFGWRAGVWTAVIGLIALEALRGRDVAVYGAPEPRKTDAAPRAKLTGPLVWSLLLIMCCLGTEFSVTYWSSDLLTERGGFESGAAAAGVSIVLAGILVGRVAGSRAAQVLSANRVLAWSAVTAIAGFALIWASTSPVLIVLGLGIVGIGVSVQWPLGVARAVQAAGGHANRASALASVAGSTAIALAPLALGLLSEGIGFHSALLLLPALQIAALAILLLKPVGATR